MKVTARTHMVGIALYSLPFLAVIGFSSLFIWAGDRKMIVAGIALLPVIMYFFDARWCRYIIGVFSAVSFLACKFVQAIDKKPLLADNPRRMRSSSDLVLATKPFANDSTPRSWWYVISTSVLLWLALMGALGAAPFLAKLCFSVLAGFLILRLFVIYHDQQHHAILARSRLAEWGGRLFGIWALSASSVWRSSHNYHHNHNSKLRGSHIGSFPIMTKEQFLKSSRGKRFAYLFVRHPLTILFGYIFMFLYGMCLNPFLNDPRKHLDCLIALLMHVAIGAGLILLAGWQAWLLAQTIPHFIAYAIGTYLFYAQHNFPDVSFRDKSGWTYDKAALESSSYMVTGSIMGWFTANIGYHHVHHLNARIPFYRLPEAMHKIPELQRGKTTSLNPVDIFRCLRLKVWDVERQRMISLREVYKSSRPEALASIDSRQAEEEKQGPTSPVTNN